MNNLSVIRERTARLTKRRVCVLALVLLLALGSGGLPNREARAQEDIVPVDATDTSTAELEAVSSATIVPTTAAVSPDPNTNNRWNKDTATVTLSARFKGH
jgi:hypothetical protein